jgi:hypothetical protein
MYDGKPLKSIALAAYPVADESRSIGWRKRKGCCYDRLERGNGVGVRVEPGLRCRSRCLRRSPRFEE